MTPKRIVVYTGDSNPRVPSYDGECINTAYDTLRQAHQHPAPGDHLPSFHVEGPEKWVSAVIADLKGALR